MNKEILTSTRGGLTRYRLGLTVILSGAFLGRVGVRLAYGEEYFWKNSYSLFYDLAKSISAGHGLCLQWAGLKCAQRPPVYPLFLFLAIHGGNNYIWIVVLQSIIGTATALCAYEIGKELFDKQTGLLAALGVAIYPYFIMHDTALQETGLFTFLTAVAILLLLKSRRSPAKLTWMIAGVALGLAVLTRATVLVFVPLAFLWILLFAGLNRREAFKRLAIIAVAFFLVVTPWLIRNYSVVGRPTFSTLTGLTLWAGNNPYTFSRFPAESIDRSVDEAIVNLGADEKSEIERLSDDEVAQNSWFLHKGIEYIKEHPTQTFLRSISKVGVAFSWRQNPPSGGFAQLAYFLSYFPVLLLGVVGIFLTRRNWRTHSLIYGLVISFICVTAIFFGHTSHRSYLDVYLILFAAAAISTLGRFLGEKFRSSGGARPESTNEAGAA